MGKYTQTVSQNSIIIKPKHNYPHLVVDVEDFANKFLQHFKYKVVKTLSEKFEPQGITFLAILTESHFAIHTWPEYHTIHIDLVSCREIDENEIIVFLHSFFGQESEIRASDIDTLNLI